MILTEIHTSDLTADCLARVELRHNGRAIGETPTALYCGNLFHESANLLLTKGGEIGQCIEDASKIVSAKAAEERRPLTKTVLEKRIGLNAEVMEWLVHFDHRIRSRYAKIIGVEVPVRMTLVVDGQPQEFASHVDVLFRDANGTLSIDDWKTGEDVPTLEYLVRNMQFGAYAHAAMHGEFLIDNEWTAFDEQAIVNWVHIRNLTPYTRKTKVAEGDAEKVYERGDVRPLQRIVFPAPIISTQAWLDEFAIRIRMARAGLFPTNPSPAGCFLCESRQWCPSMSQEISQ